MAEAGTTSLVEVIVTDNGVPPMSTARAFRVRVQDLATLQFEPTVIAGGASGCSPLILYSSGGLTNVEFTLTHEGRLVDVAFEPAPGPRVTVVSSTTSSNAHFRILPPAGSPLQGSIRLGSICFTASANQPSGFQTFAVGEVQASRADGEQLTDCRAEPMRVGVVTDAPFLEMVTDVLGRPSLVLYGLAATRHVVRSTTMLGAEAQWQTAWEGELTGMSQVIQPPDTGGVARYYVAFRP
jgi:hypothetical protein